MRSRDFALFALLVLFIQAGLSDAKRSAQKERVARQDDDEDVDLSAELDVDEDGRDFKEFIKEEAAVSSNGQDGGSSALRFKQVIPWKIQHVINKKRKYITVSTAYTVTTTTVHVTSPTAALCAKLVNVTGACRLRRGLWVEDPIIMTFDDDMDAIDGPLSPTASLRIEPTALPVQTRETQPTSPSEEVIQPSTTSTASEEELDEEDAEEVGRLGFRNFLALKHALKRRLKMKHLVTIITTSVLTSTVTSTDYTTVTTKTFFIQLCTPSPFPFDVCPGRKK